MTNPTPAPDDGQAHDAARAIVAQVNLMSNTVGQAREIRAELTVAIAAALARERREALTEAAQVSRDYWKTNYNAPAGVTWIGDEIAAAIERLRDGEKG